ncbi:MAG: dynamin family protein [Bacteroidales bacterium]|nr:dynamin family protein [Bacteroidales bacterium]
MKDERLMTRQAEALQQELEALSQRHASVKGIGEVYASLRKIAGRAKEYADRSFVILVAGPVKSGKSTFVNLVANAFVSPTHFLECTVRPSIISSTDDPQKEVITAYRSKAPERSVEQVDAIIDSLRGLIKPEEVPEVMTESWPLTEQNIDEHVALDLSDMDKDGTLMTTIKTPGGKLLTNGVYLIDMPGFDGSRANLDSPLYKTIAARADLIILVQSSNSAITKVSDDFFRLLKENNRNVPVCLLHNVFDAAHWRDEDIKTAAVKEQLEYAVARIKEKGFNLDAKNAYVVNLGMVWDWRRKAYTSDENDLAGASEAFGKVEEEMYEVLISQRDSIRVRNVVGRTLQQIEELMARNEARLSQMDAVTARCEEIKKAFDALKGRAVPVKDDVNVDYFAMRNEITGIYTLAKRSLSGRYSTKETREIVARFIADCAKAMGKKVNEALRFLDSQVNGEAVMLWKSDIADVLRRSGVDEPLPTMSMNDFPPMEPELDMLYPDKIVPWNLFRYSVNKVNEFLAHVYYFLVGKDDATDVGYISFMLPEVVEKEAKEHKDKVLERIEGTYGRFVERKRREALAKLIADPKEWKAERDGLEALQQDLAKIRVTTENALKL